MSQHDQSPLSCGRSGDGAGEEPRLAHPSGKRKRFVKCDPALSRRAGIYGTGRCSSLPFWFKMSFVNTMAIASRMHGGIVNSLVELGWQPAGHYPLSRRVTAATGSAMIVFDGRLNRSATRYCRSIIVAVLHEPA